MATLLDSYTSYNRGLYLASDNNHSAGNSFTTPNDGNRYKMNSVVFHILRSNNVTGNAYAKLYAHSGTYGTSSVPTGSALATSDALSMATVSGVGGEYTLTFSGAEQYKMLGNTHYVIQLQFTGGGGATAAELYYDDTSPTHGGNLCKSMYNLTDWTAVPGSDAFFYVYGDAYTETYSIVTTVGQFVLTGIDTVITWLRHYYTMTVMTGGFVLTGINTIFKKGYTAIISLGQFILTGFNVSLHRAGIQWKGQSKSATSSFTNSSKHDI